MLFKKASQYGDFLTLASRLARRRYCDNGTRVYLTSSQPGSPGSSLGRGLRAAGC